MSKESDEKASQKKQSTLTEEEQDMIDNMNGKYFKKPKFDGIIQSENSYYYRKATFLALEIGPAYYYLRNNAPISKLIDMPQKLRHHHLKEVLMRVIAGHCAAMVLANYIFGFRSTNTPSSRYGEEDEVEFENETEMRYSRDFQKMIAKKKQGLPTKIRDFDDPQIFK